METTNLFGALEFPGGQCASIEESNPRGETNGKQNESWFRQGPMWYFPQIGGPQYRPQNTRILIIGTPKKVPLILGTTQCDSRRISQLGGARLPGPSHL